MNKIWRFFNKLIEESIKDDLFATANDLTYKIILGLFPFIIFLMTIIGFLNIDTTPLVEQLNNYLPEKIMDILNNFIETVVLTKNATLLSTSFLIAIYSASSGFKAVMRGINKSYGIRENRGFLIVTGTSIVLVFIFALAIILSLITLIFGENIIHFLILNFDMSSNTLDFLSTLSYFAVLFILLFSIMTIYKLSCASKLTFVQVIPGSAVTVTMWLIASKGFNIYVQRFSTYSIYGSIGGAFLLLIWLNILAIVLLFGSEINALLDSNRYLDKYPGKSRRRVIK